MAVIYHMKNLKPNNIIYSLNHVADPGTQLGLIRKYFVHNDEKENLLNCVFAHTKHPSSGSMGNECSMFDSTLNSPRALLLLCVARVCVDNSVCRHTLLRPDIIIIQFPFTTSKRLYFVVFLFVVVDIMAAAVGGIVKWSEEGNVLVLNDTLLFSLKVISTMKEPTKQSFIVYT